MSKYALMAALSFLVSTALPVAAVTNELTAFGPAKLGSTTAEVKKVFPKMEALAPTANLGAQAFTSDHLTRYVVHGAQVPELKRTTDVELRFWDDKLWGYVVYYGEGNEQLVTETLTKRLGPPNGTNPQKPGWAGASTMAFVETSQHWYAVTDNALSKQAQTWFIANIQKVDVAVPVTPAGSSAPPAAANAGAAAASTPAPAATPAKTN